MQFIGMILAILGLLVFPWMLIAGLIKPAWYAKWEKIPNTRKGIAKFFGIASLASLILGVILLGLSGEPEVETVADKPMVTDPIDKTPVKSKVEAENTAPSESEVVEAEPEESVVDESATVAAPEPVEEIERTELPDFGITSDEFVRNYNAVISKVDENMIINSIEDGQTVTYAPMPNNASMSGVVADNGNLRGIVLGLGGSESNIENLKVMAISLAAANAVQGSEGQKEISKAVTDLISAAINNENESQKRVIGNVQYAANFMPSLGGVFFTIDAAE